MGEEKSSSERVRRYREKMKASGFRDIHVSLPPEYKDLLDKYCIKTKMPQASVICYLLDCAEERVLPEIEKPFE